MCRPIRGGFGASPAGPASWTWRASHKQQLASGPRCLVAARCSSPRLFSWPLHRRPFLSPPALFCSCCLDQLYPILIPASFELSLFAAARAACNTSGPRRTFVNSSNCFAHRPVFDHKRYLTNIQICTILNLIIANPAPCTSRLHASSLLDPSPVCLLHTFLCTPFLGPFLTRPSQ